eukprot:TRINITY_DN55964_c0_g1_i1.p2 TRINITY_DN55964_c0_g1~~TRINITY_DN55964_c0_g1_i1.p2  ORF type:complete len:219 (-),score=49.46 TRINITY_DN55964_c0_g1_i1:92-748(-)
MEADKAIALYHRAHGQRYKDYTQLINQYTTAADAHSTQQMDSAAHMMRSHAENTRRVRDYGRDDFMVWYTEDMRQFEEFDNDQSGFLDQQEFGRFVQKKFACSGAESGQMFDVWDVDKGQSVGPYEFVSMMAVYHSEKHFGEAEAESKVSYKCVDSLVSGGVCGLQWAMYFGVSCSLCTLCLSWIPMYLSLIHISEPTRLLSISYAVFCLKKKNKKQT